MQRPVTNAELMPEEGPGVVTCRLIKLDHDCRVRQFQNMIILSPERNGEVLKHASEHCPRSRLSLPDRAVWMRTKLMPIGTSAADATLAPVRTRCLILWKVHG